MNYRHVQTIGGKGGASEQFTATLRGIWIDREDRLYAVGDAQVKVYDAAGALKRRWRTSKPASAVAVADDGTIYAGEEGLVEVFDPAGKPLRVWRNVAPFGFVSGIGFHGRDVLIADTADRAIHRCTPDGKLLRKIGKDNRTQGFLIPNGVLDFSVDPSGIIYASNGGKHRVERYSADGELLGHIGRFDGVKPEGFGGCCNPTNVAVANKLVYTTEKAGPRAKVLDAGGQLLGVIATDIFDPMAKNMDIAVDSRGRVYVADTVKLAILVFEVTP